jgi:Cysteine-rich CPCC
MNAAPERPGFPLVYKDGQKLTVFECPCCELPTLTEPLAGQICKMCDWHDSPAPAAEGAHWQYSLEAAQANFEAFRTIYDPADERFAQRRNLYLATCISLLIEFKDAHDLRNRGIIHAAYLAESECL